MSPMPEGQAQLQPLPVTLSCLHSPAPISALDNQLGVQLSLPPSTTGGPVHFKAIISDNTSENLVLESFFDSKVDNKVFGNIKYKRTPLEAFGISRCAFTTPFVQMNGQALFSDQPSPQFNVSGVSHVPIRQSDHYFTPLFFICDHIFCQKEYESEFVAILGLQFLTQNFIRAQSSATGWKFKLPQFPTSHIDELAVHTHGCCLYNGHGSSGAPEAPARGGYGIHFPSLPLGWDVYGALVAGDTHTNQKAELTAAIRALQLVYRRRIRCKSISIYTDSKYAVQGLNEWIPQWRTNDYRTTKNRGVVNADLFRSLDDEVCSLQKFGISVKLNHVPRDKNRKADALSRLGAKKSDDPSCEVATPGMLMGRELLVAANRLTQWTPDGFHWVEDLPVSKEDKA